eukprot:6030133-Amphidinium_carterae.1
MSGRSGLLNVMEFVTGLTEDYVIGGVFETYAAFLDYAKSMAESRGNRGASLRLPPVWGVDGVYKVQSVKEVTKTVRVLQKWTGHVAHLRFSDKMWPLFQVMGDLEAWGVTSRARHKFYVVIPTALQHESHERIPQQGATTKQWESIVL